MAVLTQQPAADITILIVDDSPSVRKLIELTLRREGYSLVSVDSGISALAALAETEPDLMLLDVMLVAMDGFQICNVIRRHPRLHDLPIVILSGRETDEDRATGIRAGVNAYLTKPFNPHELLSVVRDQVSARSGAGVR